MKKKEFVLLRHPILFFLVIFTSVIIILAFLYPHFFIPKRDDLTYKVYNMRGKSDDGLYKYISITNPGEEWEGYLTLTESPVSVRNIEVSVPAHSSISVLTEGQIYDVSLSDRYFQKLTKEDENCFENGYAVGVLSDSSKEICSLLENQTVDIEDKFGEDEYTYSILPFVLDEENFLRTLPGMATLVIEHYDTNALSPVMQRALQNWVAGGGILIIGDVGETDGEEPNIQKQVYGIYATLPYSLSEMAMGTPTNQNREHIVKLIENLEQVKNTDKEDYGYDVGVFEDMLYPIGDDAETYEWVFQAMMFNRNKLATQLPYLLGVLYIVICIVVYIVLVIKRKKDVYPIVVLASATLGVMIMFGMGHIFKTSRPEVATITTRDLSQGGISKTWFCINDPHMKGDFCRTVQTYDSFHAEKGNQFTDFSQKEYFYESTIAHEDSTYSFAVHANNPYQSGIYLGQKYDNPSEDIGTVCIDTLTVTDGISGEIVNQTNRDFEYLLVVEGDKSWLFETLPAGETLVCDEKKAIRCEDAAKWILSNIRNGEPVPNGYIPLIVGLWQSDYYSELTVIACTTEHPDIMEDFCKEISYESIVISSGSFDKERYTLLKEKGAFCDEIIKECYY